ncbi:hypothetical protein L1987_37210 [Smallanthus sonchifolius]|uniref:Uncharacterized protein n=1 Tax=Smallanthus sonchifolius TaxID=185202 RepID=A0ACB9HGL2_9ASTR|nr:hypothetical protein L1987_37210 [Smallanthus sonchifolius]
MKMYHAFGLVMVVVATILMEEVHLGLAVECDSCKLEPCVPFFKDGGALPSPDSPCCENIKGQHGCFCGYLKDAKYCKYLVEPRAKDVGTACGVKTPDLSACSEYQVTCTQPGV